MIKLLDNHTINKIAAGEVVESPKSVVKELVENAIDAGATSIAVELKEGGTSLIRITDNGSGIAKDEVKTAFLRHATSKMSKIEDLEDIYTLGFRGEALASIAAVAQVELMTKTKEEAVGTRVEVAAGELKDMGDCAALQGTTIAVKNLFYNVPARRKFLKKPATESAHVSDLMNKFALGHPEISFQYTNNDTVMLHTAGNNDPKASVFYVYGKEAANQMIPLSYEKGEYALKGLIGRPELSRANRTYENLFINGRFIKNAVVASAVEDAYKTRLPIGKFPVFVLQLQVNAADVDVNVHPAKLEVRFKNDNEVYEFFYTAVQKVLEQEVLIPKVSWDKARAGQKEAPPLATQQSLEQVGVTKEPTAEQSAPMQAVPIVQTSNAPQEKDEAPLQAQAQKPTPTKQSGAAASVIDALLQKTKPTEGQIAQRREAFVIETPNVAEPQPKAEPKAEPKEQEVSAKEGKPFFAQYKIIGQLFRTYWVVEMGQSMYMIDQHAAHERVLFEELNQTLREERVASQRLLSPMMLQLSPLEVQTLEENEALLASFGFEVERFAEATYGLKAVPYLMQSPSSAGFFIDILGQLQEQPLQSVYDTKQHTIATMACKAAVKGKDKLSYQEAEALIGQLLHLENPFTCPHGRPTIIEMTKYELEKKFNRV